MRTSVFQIDLQRTDPAEQFPRNTFQLFWYAMEELIIASRGSGRLAEEEANSRVEREKNESLDTRSDEGRVVFFNEPKSNDACAIDPRKECLETRSQILQYANINQMYR